MYKGVVYQNIGLQSEAIDYLTQAEKMSINQNQTELYSELYYNLAVGFYNVGEYNKCRDYLKRSIRNSMNKNDETEELINCYILLSNTFNNQDSIIFYLHLAEEFSKKRDSYYQRTGILNNKALFYKSIGKFDLSEQSYLLALSIAKENHYNENTANIYNNYAYLLMEEKKYDSARVMLNFALETAKEINNTDLEAIILDSFSDYFAVIGDSIQSFKFYKESVKLKNEYRKKQQVEKSLLLSTVFETEKKEQQIIKQKNEINQSRIIILSVILLLTISITILIYFRQKSITRKTRLLSMENEKKLDVAHALIEGQDAERKRLAMDLHDGISPRMGTLKMAIESEFQKSKGLPKIVHSNDEITQEIREMSHRMLPTQLESKGLVFAIENFIDLVSKSQSDIDIKFYTNLDQRLSNKIEVNLFYLTYEMINNAIKHSSADEIVLQLLLDDKQLLLSVADNGVGFSVENESGGLGLKNLKQRVNYIEGKLIIDSKIGEGSEITVELAV
jgi:signal transduction histidine kinase